MGFPPPVYSEYGEGEGERTTRRCGAAGAVGWAPDEWRGGGAHPPAFFWLREGLSPYGFGGGVDHAAPHMPVVSMRVARPSVRCEIGVWPGGCQALR